MNSLRSPVSSSARLTMWMQRSLISSLTLASVSNSGATESGGAAGRGVGRGRRRNASAEDVELQIAPG